MRTQCGATVKPQAFKKDRRIDTRDVALDALRGLMLISIAIDHMPNVPRVFTYQPFGFVSAAEGFVFLSGYVTGLVYTGTALGGGQAVVWRRAALRAGRIYLYHTAVFMLLLVAIMLGALKSQWLESLAPLSYQNPGLALVLGLTLTYQPRLLDVLPMYCVFVLIAPLVIGMLLRKQFLGVLTLSVGGWVGAQLGVGVAVAGMVFGRLPINLGGFDVWAWQILFVVGVICGFQRCMGHDHRFKPVILVSAYVGCLVLFAFRHDLLLSNMSDLGWPLAAKTTLGPLRILNFAALAVLLSQECIWPANAVWVRALAYLGRNSLQVFSFNIVCIYLVFGLFGTWVENNEWAGVVAVFVCIVGLFIPAWLRENHNPFRRHVAR